jgi:hypothetical protein
VRPRWWCWGACTPCRGTGHGHGSIGCLGLRLGADNKRCAALSDMPVDSSRGPHRAPPLYSAGSAAVGIEDRARDALARLAASRKPSSQFNINKQPVQHYGAAALAQQPVQPPAPAPRPGLSHVGGRPLGVGMPDLPPRPRLAPYAGESPNRPARPGVDFAPMGGRRTPGRRPGVIDRAIMNGAPPRPNTGTPRLNTGAPHLNSPVAQARARFVSPQRGANMNGAPRLNAGAPRPTNQQINYAMEALAEDERLQPRLSAVEEGLGSSLTSGSEQAAETTANPTAMMTSEPPKENKLS